MSLAVFSLRQRSLGELRSRDENSAFVWAKTPFVLFREALGRLGRFYVNFLKLYSALSNRNLYLTTDHVGPKIGS